MRRRPLLVPVVAAVAAALLTAGCGITDNAAKPGLAAEVDGQTLQLDKVDRAVADFCALRAANPEAPAMSTALVRAQFVTGWTQAVAVDVLGAEHGVALPQGEIDRVAVDQAWGRLGTINDDNFDSFAWLTWISLRLAEPVAELGSKLALAESGQQLTGDAAANRGVEAVTAWLDDEHVVLNPVFGQYDDRTVSFSGDPLSIPVSGEARAADKTAELTPEQVAKLPAGQVCGKAVPVPAAPVGG
ncbi:hypothetical protein [Pimelobacter simplex]|uniref:hypothetical protein n=1 Tax=Nocardioides simplex TaxID=2045 RepID=UPI003AAF2B66